MAAVQQFQIVLDAPNGVYFAGQNVSGRVVLQLSQQMNIGGVRIHIKSRAKVRWQEGGSKGPTYTAREKYMDTYVTLSGDKECAPGTYYFPFSFLLPHGLPITFICRYGNVMHSVKAILDSRIVFKHKAKVALILLPSINVQDMPVCKEPVRVVKVKKLNALFSSAGTITAALSLPFTGFVPGQQVPFSIELDNDSDINISDVVCKLEKMKVKLSGLHSNMRLYAPVMLGVGPPLSECAPPPFEDCFATSAVHNIREDIKTTR